MRCRLLRPLLVVAGLALMLAATAHAQEPLSLSIVHAEDAAFPEVTVVFTVEANGRPVPDLALDQVRATEGGLPADVVSVERAIDGALPLTLVLAIDVSGSMEGETLAQAQAAAAGLVARLEPGDSVAVLTFANEVALIQSPTADHAAAISAIEALVAEGNTRLFDAVAESVRVASASTHRRRAVVLLSDGQEFGQSSEHSRATSLQLANAGAALVYSIAVGPEADRAYLEEVAAGSGGRLFTAPSAADVGPIYETLESLLRSQYVLRVRSNAAPEGLRSVGIEVSVDGLAGAAQRTYTSVRPAPLPAAPTPTVAAEVTAAPPPVATPVAVAAEAEGGVAPWLPVAAGAIAVTCLVVAARLLFRGRRRGRGRMHVDAAPELQPASRAPMRHEATGVLHAIGGPVADLAFELSSTPQVIGTDAGCDIRLPLLDGVAPRHLRLWWRDGRPMVHHTAQGYQTTVDGRLVRWASLEAGSELAIGTLVLRYRPPAPGAALDASVEVVPSASPPTDRADLEVEAEHAP